MTRPPGREEVKVRDWRLSGVEVLTASQPESFFFNRQVFQRPDEAEWKGQLASRS